MPIRFKLKDVKGEEPTFFIEDGNENCIHDFPRLLCELLEFDYDKDVWKEKSRLIKFEETVEEGGERWSKPHVAALSIEAVLQTKDVLENAILFQDIQAENYKDFTEKLFTKLESDTDLKEEQLEELGKLLYKKHRHLKGRYKKLGDGSGSNTPTDNRSPSPIRSSRTEPVLKQTHLGVKGISPKPSMSDLLELLDSQRNDEIFTPSKKFAKHLPKNCEAADVLVGHADFLEEPICLWVRLKEPKILSETLTEVLVPTRFFILFLGPKLMYNYKEIGRVMATMLADSYFRPCAFSAHSKDDLIEGFQESIEAGTALPPGQWDKSLRIEPPSNLPSHPIRKRPSKNSIAKDKESIQYEDTEDHAEEHGDATLVRTGRLFGGLIQDIKRKAPYYLSDFKDALHPQCLASVIFIYIACLSPIITFGGLQGAATDNYLAAMEGILSGAICGVIYVLTSGQPLTVLGATGPMLVFETILFRLCKTVGWQFLSMRLWVGVWSGLYLIIICALDLSALVTYITRFTEEAFATLICIIFIQQAISKLLSIRKDYGVNTEPFNIEKSQCYCFPKPNKTLIDQFNFTTSTSMPYTTTSMENATMATGPTLLPTLLATKDKCLELGGNPVGDGCKYVPDVFFFSVLLFIVMFTVSTTLKYFRNSPFFPSKVRQIISDFNVVIGVIISVLIDWLVGLDTPKLKVPEQFKPTRWQDRGWIVPVLGGNPWYTILIAAVPALLCTILIFLDQQITAVIVNRKENKLKKGAGYHLDIFILSLVTILTSVMGLPWFVAATVRAMTHVNSLRVESEAAAPGEKPEFYGIRENRVTLLLVSILIGLSVQLTSVFKMIPMPVLYGVFMYMGVGALNGLQLVDRLLLLLMPQKHQPEYNYLKKVKTWRVHVFTLIQVVCLGLLWAIKAIKVTSIAFPLMILLICVVRKLMERFYTQAELGVLDNILPQESSKKDKKKRSGWFKRLRKSHKEEV